MSRSWKLSSVRLTVPRKKLPARVEKQQMKGQIAVLEEQVRSARLSTKHYQERMESIGNEMQNRQEERSRILEEKQDLDVHWHRHRRYRKRRKTVWKKSSSVLRTVRLTWRTVRVRSWLF